MTKNSSLQNNQYFSFIRCPSHRFNVPQRVQRLLILEFAAKMGFEVGFYVPRLAYDGAFLFFEQKILEGTTSPGFIAYSIDMLDDLDLAIPYLKKMIDHGYHMWFATEEILIEKHEDLKQLTDYRAILSVSRNNAERMSYFAELCNL
jgi:hypothetical protein